MDSPCFKRITKQQALDRLKKSLQRNFRTLPQAEVLGAIDSQVPEEASERRTGSDSVLEFRYSRELAEQLGE